MKLLVLATDYPHPDGYIALYYVHVRNKYYTKNGLEVSVINFSAKHDYVIDGINVYTLKSYKLMLQDKKFDLLISHASNIRNHYLFLRKYEKLFNKIVFVFHGHEVLRCSEVYPKPYNYVKRENALYRSFKDFYDIIKLIIWRKYYPKLTKKSYFIFVSQWIYNAFLTHVKMNAEIISSNRYIISNSVGEPFEKLNYDVNCEKLYDFLTIRSDLDGSTYGIDIVTRLAVNHPNYTFCVIGKGEYYKFNKKPDNLILIERYMNHDEIISFINSSRCALLPTRHDTQGVMACEFATFGIPLITSDIPVCREVFREFRNVAFINNEDNNVDLTEIFKNLISIRDDGKNHIYFSENTCGKEIELFFKIIGEKIND